MELVFPLPDTVICDLCGAARFIGANRKGDYVRHLVSRHGVPRDRLRLVCEVCGFASVAAPSRALKEVNRHLRQSHGLVAVPVALPAAGSRATRSRSREQDGGPTWRAPPVLRMPSLRESAPRGRHVGSPTVPSRANSSSNDDEDDADRATPRAGASTREQRRNRARRSLLQRPGGEPGTPSEGATPPSSRAKVPEARHVAAGTSGRQATMATTTVTTAVCGSPRATWWLLTPSPPRLPSMPLLATPTRPQGPQEPESPAYWTPPTGPRAPPRVATPTPAPRSPLGETPPRPGERTPQGVTPPVPPRMRTLELRPPAALPRRLATPVTPATPWRRPPEPPTPPTPEQRQNLLNVLRERRGGMDNDRQERPPQQGAIRTTTSAAGEPARKEVRVPPREPAYHHE
jgi:hypothetical protein